MRRDFPTGSLAHFLLVILLPIQLEKINKLPSLQTDLIRRIMIDAQNFDTRWWLGAVAVVMGTLVILTLGTCIVLYKECRDAPGIKTIS